MKLKIIAIFVLIIVAVVVFLRTQQYSPATEASIKEKVTKDLVDSAYAYQDAMEAYFNVEIGKREWALKMNLREAYIKCDATHDDIVEYVDGYGKELDRKLREWNLKIEKGLLERKDPTVSLEDFAERAEEYVVAHYEATTLPEYDEYVITHNTFKEIVISLMEAGRTTEEILQNLEDGNITNKRVLSRIEYWQKKAL
ncbi:MAG: hypothetical protein HN411_00775 [Waddliaceae bacterium]|jgi:hypothetical protein|nr:hypothetical protein [Waddliaceae bacterium]MBT3579530.1 hypothetical protein [Waddliaceae bacterium]MBT4444552.1 hypothetical protein [Waddliaceae bacterium]MBT6928643.1 hypothetical protein [Waddliaceae bacterium]MBT7265181.1 hypothetical protein [Waddliaceae bacterium]